MLYFLCRKSCLSESIRGRAAQIHFGALSPTSWHTFSIGTDRTYVCALNSLWKSSYGSCPEGPVIRQQPREPHQYLDNSWNVNRSIVVLSEDNYGCSHYSDVKSGPETQQTRVWPRSWSQRPVGQSNMFSWGCRSRLMDWDKMNPRDHLHKAHLWWWTGSRSTAAMTSQPSCATYDFRQ